MSKKSFGVDVSVSIVFKLEVEEEVEAAYCGGGAELAVIAINAPVEVT